MIIRSITKIYNHPNFKNKEMVQLAHFYHKPLYFFSRRPQKKQSLIMRLLFFLFKNDKSKLKIPPNNELSQAYIRKMSHRKHMIDSPLLKRLRNQKRIIDDAQSYNNFNQNFLFNLRKKNAQSSLNKIIQEKITQKIDKYLNKQIDEDLDGLIKTNWNNRKSKQQKQQKQQKQKKQIKFPLIKYILYLFLSTATFISIINYQQKRRKNLRIFNKNEYKQSQNISIDQLTSEKNKMQEFICSIKKINIIQKSISFQIKNNQHLYKTSYQIRIQDKNDQQFMIGPYQGDPNHLLRYIEKVQQKYHVTNKAEIFFQNDIKYTFQDAMLSLLGFCTPFISVFITIYIFRRMDPTSMLKNFGTNIKQFKIQAMKDINIKFKDVAGMQQSKKQITQFVDFLKNNQKYRQMGAKIPKGALLTGPPGTGKTMLAKACAGQAGVSFFYISGSQFVEVFVGLGASKVRNLFAKARQNAPSIIFIDQIDAIGKKRENSRNQQKDTTLNQLLVQMDGFSSNQTVVVLAATNRKQTLDNALTRPGRFDRIVEINLPDVKAREQIFMVHLAPLKIDPKAEMRAIAKRLSELSPGFSGADIANLCNEAAIIATRKSREFIIDKDFEQATQRVTAGYVKKGLMNEKNKKRVAYHQAGHAVSSWFLKGGDPLVKLTIIPRSKGSLGYAQYLPKTSYIIARNQLIDKVAIMLGGITSQQLFFGEISSGGSDDLQKVYGLTRKMITQFGMGKQTYNMTSDQQSYIQKQSTYLLDKMEQQVKEILSQARKRCKDIILAKKQIIQSLAKELIQKQTLNNEQILKIMGERPDFDGSRAKKQAEHQELQQKQSIKAL